MKEHHVERQARRHRTPKLIALIAGCAAVLAAIVVTANVASNGRGDHSLPVAGSGSAQPHTTYQQPVVDPINLGGTTLPPTPAADGEPSEAEPPTGSGG
jgi:hypothetical protein